MLYIKPVSLQFQLVGLLQKVKHCRRFAVNSILFHMLPDVFDCCFIFLNSSGIFLLETTLRPARFALILLVNRLQLVTVLHLCNESADCGTPTKRKVAVCIVDIAVFTIIHGSCFFDEWLPRLWQGHSAQKR